MYFSLNSPRGYFWWNAAIANILITAIECLHGNSSNVVQTLKDT